MKRFSQRSGHSAMAELNVTPLLDLAFVLLIIFIITTPLLENHIKVDLPSNAPVTNPPVDPKSIRTVTVDRSGQVFLDSRPVDLPVLEQELIAFRAIKPDAAVVVRADKSLPYQKVVDVMGVLQRAQITRMNLDNVSP